MTDIAEIVAAQPDVLRGSRETRYRWGSDLAVLVLDSGEVGQFSTPHPWSRAEIEAALNSAGLVSLALGNGASAMRH